MSSPLRPMRAGDAATVTDHHDRCWHVAFAPLVSEEVMAFVNARPREPRIRALTDRARPGGEFTTVVAVDEKDRAIGHVMVAGNEIVHLFIDPDHHGRGQGRRLLAHGEAMIAADGFREAELHTIVGNATAIGLYESCGWQVTDATVREELPNGSSYVEHVLRKDLDGQLSEARE